MKKLFGANQDVQRIGDNDTADVILFLFSFLRFVFFFFFPSVIPFLFRH